MPEIEAKSKRKKTNNAAAAATASPPVPAPPSAAAGAASHVSNNPYAALESDDEDGFCQDVGLSYVSVAGNAKSASALYSVAPFTPNSTQSHSSCLGSSLHVASLPFSNASSVATPSVVIADSGATDHM